MSKTSAVLEALHRTLALVESSRSSAYASETLEIAQEVRSLIATLEAGAVVDRSHLGVLFAPTGPIQETALDNGWGDEFLSLAGTVDKFLAKD